MRTPRTSSILVAILPCLLLAACGNSGGSPDAGGDPAATAKVASLTVIAPAPESAAAGQALATAPVIEARDAAGAAVANATLTLKVARGGGGAAATVVTGSDGRAQIAWTLGRVPVANALEVTAGAGSARLETRGALATPWSTERLGDVDTFLDGVIRSGSTEDLAFRAKAGGGHELLLAAPSTLFALDAAGKATQIPTTGATLVNPLGIAIDAAGAVWVADSKGMALLRIGPDGKVEKVIDSDGKDPLVAPNFVAIGPDGRVYLSDPCLGKLLRYDPKTKKVDATLAFDRKTQAGPNGFAFDKEGKNLWLATENTGLLCQHTDVTIDANIAGLFRIPVGDSGFGAIETVAGGQGLFGDGVAVDVEDNVYVIFDQQENFALKESAIWVLPKGEKKLQKLVATKDRLYANLEFGQGAFGETTLYASLLAIVPFASERGVHRLEVGIAGLPLRQ